MELAGLVRHLALDVERFWFRTIVAGEPVDIDASETESEAWHVPEVMSGSAVLDLYRREIEHANAIIAATVLDSAPTWWPVERWPNWRLQNVRNVVLHVITETACHAGHLDAARELIDGRTWLVVTDREARCWPCVDQRSAGARPPRARWIQNRRSGSMRSKLRIGPSTVIAVIALFVALGGTAYASSQINGADLRNRSVPGDKLKQHAVTGTDVKVSSFPKVPYAHMADDATHLDGHAFAQINASASAHNAATLLSGFGGLNLECIGPAGGGDAGTVTLAVVSDGPQAATFGASAIDGSGSHFDEGPVAPATGKVPETTSFSFPIIAGAQVTFSYKRTVGKTTTAVSGVFTMVLDNGCSAFGNAEVSSATK
ncbi:MAG: DUF664 domain-containing protein [Acidimicrobiales bacterium]